MILKMTKLKKATIVFIAVLVLTIGIAIVSFGTNSGTINKEAKLRKTTSNTSIVLEIIPKKEKVEILAEDGDWYQVRYNKIKGYVQKEFVDVPKETSENTTQNTVQGSTKQPETNNKKLTIEEAKKGTMITIKSEMKLYIRPLINSKIIYNLKQGENIKILEIRNGWAYINTSSKNGWIKLEETEKQDNNQDTTNNSNNNDNDNNNNNIDNTNSIENNNSNDNNTNSNTNNTTANNNSSSTLNKTAYITSTGINFRQEAGTDSKVLKVFAQNAKVTILEEQGDWYKIRHNDQEGYVLKTYVSEKKTETTSRGGVDRNKNSNTNQDNTKKEETKTENKVETTSKDASTKGEEVANYAKQFIGYKYVYGASSPSKGFDCSGLTMYVYKQFGVNLSHSATAQSKVGTKVNKSNLKPGDLVFFTDYKTGKGIGHVGIYIGNNNFVHASTEKTGVKTSSLTSGSYSRRYVTATRLF